MKKHKKYSQQQVEKILELHEEGLSSRKICSKLGLPTSRKSSINNIIKQNLKEVDSVEFEDMTDEQMEVLCEHPDWSVSNLAKRLRAAQRTNNQLRKIQREVFDQEDTVTLSELLSSMVDKVERSAPVKLLSPQHTLKNMTAEILLSDVQWGKLMHGYNSEVATERVKEYASQVINDILVKEDQGVYFDKILLVFLGDIIESDKKHANSGRACDTGTAEQMKTATEVLFTYVIEPLARLGYPMEIVSITGNHDHDGHGLNMYQSGAQHLSWPLYHTLKMLTEAKGYTHVIHDIPEGMYTIKNIYGFNVLYEHGVGVSTSEAALSKRMAERGNQVRKHITYMRMGDKHNISRFNNDTKIVNGAFFGNCDDNGGGEYSAIVGYSSEPAQLVIYHEERPEGDPRLSISDSLLVQLGHIKKDQL